MFPPFVPPDSGKDAPQQSKVSPEQAGKQTASVHAALELSGLGGDRLAQLGIIGTQGMTGGQIADELRRGGKFVVFQYCVSVLVVTVVQTTQIYFVRAGQSAAAYSARFTLLSLLFGWWGLPWGLIRTLQVLFTNAQGIDVTQQVLASAGAFGSWPQKQREPQRPEAARASSRKMPFVFDNTPLVCALAGLGSLFLCCGGNVVWKSSQSNTEPKSVTMQELESAASLPDCAWLDCREGYLFWPGARESIKYSKNTNVDPKYSTTTEAVYVPLLSKATFDNWLVVMGRDGQDAFLPYNQCRVVVKFDIKDLEMQFPEVAAALRSKKPFDYRSEPQPSIQGAVRRLDEEESFVVEGLSKRTSGFKAKMILVLHQGKAPPGDSEFNRILGWCVFAFGVFLVIPLGVWSVRRWRKPKAKNADGLSPHPGQLSGLSPSPSPGL
jgi:hypothetical protein